MNLEQLESYIQNYFGLEQEELQKISQLFRTENVKRGDFYLKKSTPCNKLSFVRSGQFRIYTQSPDKEVTQWIATAGYFITDLSALCFKSPARWDIQALTDGELFTIDRQNYERIGEIVKSWHQLEKLFLAKCFSILEDRIHALLSQHAEERYRLFFRSHPDLFNTVPQQYLASMLGMSPETFSRIKAKLGKEKT